MKIEKKDLQGKVWFGFSGPIDEDSVFPPLPIENQITIDLGKVERINSCGIREWVSWFKTIPKDKAVVLEDCPKSIIDQINTVEGFLPSNAAVGHFFIPYYCESCGHLTSMKAEATTNFQVPEKKVPCAKCGKNSDLDVLPEKYFKFLGKPK